MPPCITETQTILFDFGEERFQTQTSRIIDQGFTILSETISSEEQLNFKAGDQVKIKKTNLITRKTTSPSYLTEAELVTKMEKHSIGTDASIPTHIQNICQRNYVKVESGRKLVPTKLGRALIKAYQELDPELALPTMRAEVEAKVNLIARNEADYDQVKTSVLDTFRQKFDSFTGQAQAINYLFTDCFPNRDFNHQPNHARAPSKHFKMDKNNDRKRKAQFNNPPRKNKNARK
uniref:DNA topoisomerase n=1 Tax=Acrobeloides nanus TaxID=290746 RepID=A0A914CBT4_9BILA